MTYQFPNRVAFHVANNPGVGAFAVGTPLAGFRSPAQAGLVAGDQFPYGAGDEFNGACEWGDITVNSDGTLNRTVLGGSNGASPAIFSPNVIVVSSPRGEQIVAFGMARNVKAGFLLNGGGMLDDTGSNIAWTEPFWVIGGGVGSDFGADGVFAISQPSLGTQVIGVGGASTQSINASGFHLSAGQALYYILPIGAGQASVPSNFRVVGSSVAVDIPDTWVFIASRNPDDGFSKWGNGAVLPGGELLLASGANGTVAATPWSVVKRDSAGNINVASVASTPTTVAGNGLASAYAAGTRFYVTDLTSPTLYATATGGGSVKGFMFSDGTNWKVG